ncbi:MAG: endopeptidase La [Gammaproteobacteria bacterium]|nr:endopeptidase La [Gammaproteobacteria bacterium]
MPTLPLLPLKNLVIFPTLVAPVAVGRARSLASVKVSANGAREVIVVLQRDPEAEEPTREELHEIGTLCTVSRVEERNGGAQVIVQGNQRVRIENVDEVDDYLSVVYTPIDDLSINLDDDVEPRIEALHREVLELARDIANSLNPDKGDQIFQQFIGQIDEPISQMYKIASVAQNLSTEERQELLQINSENELLTRIHEVLQHEHAVTEIQKEIQSQARDDVENQQREHVLRHQKRAIEQALGEDEGDEDIAELKDELRQANLPESVQKEVDRELKRLSRMSPNAADYQVSRGYLELVAELPWNVITEDNLELQSAKEVLDEDHFGLDDVKERILEALAVLLLNPETKASILCFVGPPGVGKTSLGQSIARAMGRKFERMSLGGLHDEAELRGHRRTYIGAMPGRILQAVRRCGVRNPVLMLDELDKMGRDYRGDPGAALMEILDPAQNKEFRDNYLNLPFDLSKVFFITTANTLEGIPRALIDRMEVLELTGYSELEKVEIARRFLIPRQQENAGLKPEQLELTDEGLRLAIQRYTREAGVRELERTISRLARKRAKDSLLNEPHTEPINESSVTEMLGPERFKSDKSRARLTNGVATGLAWTEAGGDVLYVEASLTHKDEKVTITGHIGQVMQESVKAARSCIWTEADTLNIDRSKIEDSGVHVHVPAGAVPKDGPSAGITMATALASAYSEKKVRDDIAMTGELTLSGLVLPVGGIREKVLAAHRSGIRHVILPKENESELEKLPEAIRSEMELSLVETLSDVMKLAIPEL